MNLSIAIALVLTKLVLASCPNKFDDHGLVCVPTTPSNAKSCPFREELPFSIAKRFAPETGSILLPTSYDKDCSEFKITHGNSTDQRTERIFRHSGKCVGFNASGENFQPLVGECSEFGQNLCVYNKNTTLSFCEAFDKICGGKNCGCKTSLTLGYFCRELCTSAQDNCEDCDAKFEAYGAPKLTLIRNGKELYLRIQNPLKLKRSTYRDPVECYLDRNTSTHFVKPFKKGCCAAPNETENAFEFLHIRTKENEVFYQINKGHYLSSGRYSCKGFSYPNLHVVVSNVVSYKSNKNEFTFAVNTSLYPNLLNIKIETNLLACYKGNVSTLHLTSEFSDDWNELEKLHGAKNTEFCLPDDFNGITRIGHIVLMRGCYTLQRDPVFRTCLGDSLNGGFWEDKGCEITDLTQEDLQISQGNKSSQEQLDDLIQDIHTNLEPTHVYKIAESMSAAVDVGNISVESLTNVVSEIINLDKNVLMEAQLISNATDKIIGAFESSLANYVLKNKENLVITTRNVDVNVVKMENGSKIVGVAFFENAPSEVVFDISAVQTRIGLQSILVLSPELRSDLENAENDTFLVATAFKKSALFAAAGPSHDKMVLPAWPTSAAIPGVNTKILGSPLKIYLKPIRNFKQEHFCSFWQYGVNDESQSVQGRWVNDMRARKEGDFYVCEYYHMTNYALYLEMPRDAGIEIISLIGNTLSLVAIAGIFLTAIVNRKWGKTNSAKIALCTCVPIVLQNVFLVVANVIDRENEAACISVGVVLHYSTVSQFAWMLVIGVLQYRRFVKVFDNPSPRDFLVFNVIGWGLPLIPISAILGLNYRSYLKDEFCFLSQEPLYYGVFVPVGATVAVNLLIFIVIFSKLCCSSKIQCSRDNQKHIVLCFRLSVFLFFSMGFSWVLALLSNFFKSMVCSYMFTVLVSILGMVMFYYHVALNKEAFSTWTKVFSTKKSCKPL